MSPGGTSPDSSVRRAALVTAKLDALVKAHWGTGPRRTDTFAPGAALVAPAGADGDPSTAWLYVADRPERALGAVLVWAERHEVDEIHVLADDGAPLLARRAGLFAEPTPSVWLVAPNGPDRATGVPTSSGVADLPYRVIAAEPEPRPVLAIAGDAQGLGAADLQGANSTNGTNGTNGHRPVPVMAPDLVEVLARAGVEVVTEAGIVRGEVNGLEVARIVDGETTGGVPLDEPALEVGVGAADRELTAMLHGDSPPVDQLSRAVDIVRQHRQADAPRHPLNQLVPERWLRAVLVRQPDAIGLAELHPAEGTRPRPNLRDVDVAVAAGKTPEGRSVVVACSVGIDVELVPAAADARAALDPSAELWLVVPERDDHPVTRRLAARLRSPARVVTVGHDWRRLGQALT